jgi:hypothetical protein
MITKAMIKYLVKFGADDHHPVETTITLRCRSG